MPKPLTKTRARIALILALAVDGLQIGLQLTGPFQALLDWPLDLLTALGMMALLGFHWAFLPTFLLEAVPWLDAVPTWTLAVLIATRDRKEVQGADSGSPTLAG